MFPALIHIMPPVWRSIHAQSPAPPPPAPLTSRRGGQAVVSPPSTSRAPSGTSARGTTRTPLGGAGGAPRAVSAASSAQLQQLTAQVAEMQAMCESVEKERDFYFDSESGRGDKDRSGRVESGRVRLEGCSKPSGIAGGQGCRERIRLLCVNGERSCGREAAGSGQDED